MIFGAAAAGAAISGAAATTASVGLVTGGSGAAGAAFYSSKMATRAADVSEFGFVQLTAWDGLPRQPKESPSQSRSPAKQQGSAQLDSAAQSGSCRPQGESWSTTPKYAPSGAPSQQRHGRSLPPDGHAAGGARGTGSKPASGASGSKSKQGWSWWGSKGKKQEGQAAAPAPPQHAEGVFTVLAACCHAQRLQNCSSAFK